MKVDNFSCYGLVDSGASLTLCSTSILSKNAKVDPRVDVNVRGVTGTHLKLLGTTNVWISIGTFSKQLKVHVVEEMADNVFIIGRDILEVFECVIDYKHLQFKIGDNSIPLFRASPSKSYKKPMNLHCSTTTIVPPHSMGFLPCHLKKKDKYSKRIFMTISGASEPKFQNTKLQADPSLINTVRGKAHMHVMNLSDQYVTIYRNQKVGKFCTFHPVEVNTLNRPVPKSNNDTNSKRVHFPNVQSYTTESNSKTRWEDNIHELYDILKLDSLTHLSTAQITTVKSIISDFRDIFSENSMDLGLTDIAEHEIILDTQVPIRDKYYNVPLALRKQAEKEINRLMELKIIESSTSSYHSPSFLMKRPDGQGYRILTDFRKINSHVMRSFQPIPGLQEMVVLWNKCKLYSKMDFAKGFYQTPLKKESRQYTATSIPGVAFFQYVRSPLGLSSSPCYYQSLVEKIFMGLKQSECVCYLDDILSAHCTFEGMVRNLKLIFQRIRESKMLLKPDKCELFREKLKFLGVVLSEKGVSTCPEKVDSIVKMGRPSCITGIRSFLGRSGFYRRFCRSYSAVAAPMTRLTKKGAKFEWNSEVEQAWNTIKEMLVNSPILAHPDLDKRFTLISDASAYAIGAILAQKR